MKVDTFEQFLNTQPLDLPVGPVGSVNLRV